MVGAISCNHQRQNNVLQPEKITVGITTSYLGEAAAFTAKEKGFFEDYGLDVTLKLNPSGAKSIKDLFRGEVDIAHVAETPVIYTLLDSSYYKGDVPSFQIITDMIFSHNIQRIIARKDHGISNPKDIVGKKVATYKGTQLDYYLDSFLLEHQIPQSSITTVNLDPVAQVEAINSGEVDVAVNWEPYATYIEQNLGDNATSLETELTYSTLWMASTLDSYAESNPDVLENYLRALKKAQDYIKSHPRETKELLAEHTGISLEVLDSLWDEVVFELSLSERMLTLLEEQARWMSREGIADTTDFRANQIINYEPMRKVYPEGIIVNDVY